MQSILTWQFILDNLLLNQEVMLLYVIESKGSSPGRQGFMMAVNQHKQLQGTIGGGIMELKMVELSHQKLKNKRRKLPLIQQQVHDKKSLKKQSGMICSGEQSIVFYQIKAEDKATIIQIIHCLKSNANGTFRLTPEKISFSKRIPRIPYMLSKSGDKSYQYTEKIGYKDELHIIGAGHCSLALSKLFAELDFRIHVYDDRPKLNTFERNSYAHFKQVVQSYDVLKTLIPQGENIYVVIMTIGYRSDAEVLKTIIHQHYKYIGMLGSKTKIDQLFEEFRAQEISEVLLQKVHAPIGISIQSETSSEIAVSIAAEIISMKNKDKK